MTRFIKAVQHDHTQTCQCHLLYLNSALKTNTGCESRLDQRQPQSLCICYVILERKLWLCSPSLSDSNQKTPYCCRTGFSGVSGVSSGVSGVSSGVRSRVLLQNVSTHLTILSAGGHQCHITQLQHQRGSSHPSSPGDLHRQTGVQTQMVLAASHKS